MRPGLRRQGCIFWARVASSENATCASNHLSNPAIHAPSSMRQEEQDLADTARVLAGDAGAFQGIVERWQFRLVNLAWRFSRDRATAEDMAQEVFIKVFRSLASFCGESAFSTWITAVAVNTYRSRIRTHAQ